MPFRSHPYRSWLLLALLCALLAAQLPIRMLVAEGTATISDIAESIATASVLPVAAIPMRLPLASAGAVDLAPASLSTAHSSDPLSILRL